MRLRCSSLSVAQLCPTAGGSDHGALRDQIAGHESKFLGLGGLDPWKPRPVVGDP